MCEEESEDSEAVAKLLDINDSIHRTVERYKLIKKGDVEAASKIPKGTLGTSTGVGKNAANELSLIDFDPEATAENGTAPAASSSKTTTVEDDLLGLSMDDKSSGQGGGIALGFGANTGVPGPPLLSSAMQQNSATPSATTSSPPLAPRPNYDTLSPLAGSRASPKPASPSPMQQQQRKPPTAPYVPADPFAALVAPNSRSSSPFNYQPAAKPPPTSSSLLDLSAESSSPVTAPSQNGVTVDDEWNFASSLPESSLPASHRLEVHSSSIKIEFLATRPAGQQPIRIMAQFSNKTDKAIQGLHFQVAVEKVCCPRRWL
jgi:ADP-ribosylation factor-binding protein GGA